MIDPTGIFPTLRGWLESGSADVEAIIFDIDGVLLVRGEAAPGSLNLIEMLRRTGFPFYLLTNDGDHSTEEKAEILNRAGLMIEPEEIVSCADGLTEITDSMAITEAPFFIMGNLGDPCFAEKAGLEALRDLEKIDSCQGIIVGERGYDWEKTINAAVNFFIKKREALFIVPNPDEYYPGAAGEICIAAGGVARFIVKILRTYGIGIEPLYLGKPFLPIFRKTRTFLEKKRGSKISEKRILMIGDYINSDIKGAINFGCRSAIVLTGVTTLEMLDNSDVLPDLVFHRLGD